MAVAVKPPQEVVTKKRPVPRLPLVSLAGMIYLIAGLAIVFGLLPSLWYSFWPPPPDKPPSLGSQVLLGMVGLVVIVALAVVGVKLLGPNPPAGARAGIFVALVLLLVIAFVTKWLAATLEGWIYDNEWFGAAGRTVGSVISGVIGALLLLWVVRSFFKPGFGRFLENFEAQGWFSARAYKPLQGLRVRRATILGIILLGGAGVYTLVVRNTLTPEPWVINVPFTGTATITPENMGDLDKLPVELNLEVEDPGNTPLEQGQSLSGEEFRRHLERFGDSFTVKLKEDTPEARAKYWAILAEHKETEARTRRQLAEEGWARTSWWQAFGGPPAVWVAEEERKQAEQQATEAAKALAQMSLQVDRYALRDQINSKLDPAAYAVVDPTNSTDIEGFERNTVVRDSEFDAKKAEIEEEGVIKFEKREVVPVEAPVSYQSVPLLPNKQLMVPLLLLALTIWFAWRLVNMPTFADFLIATEAEMNKVSWSSRRRLFQDTIVVLVTVVLMAGYLFVMDVAWQQLLSMRIVDVIRVEDEQDSIKKGADDRPLW
jgi:preprotein translocase SecE subunit